MGKINDLANTIKQTTIKHSPELLVGLGVSGMIATTVLAVKATPKALELMDEERFRKEEEEGVTGPLTKVEIVKTTWRCYIPAAVTGVLSIACIIGANSINGRRNAALTAAYTLSDSALREYKAKVIETIGEKKEREVQDGLAKDRIERNPVGSNEIIITEKGNTLCYDSISGRYFKSDIDKINRALNEVNRNLLNDMYVSLNDLYDELGLAHTSVGDELGWKTCDGLIDLYFSSQLSEDDTPCIVINYRTAPKYGFMSLM